VCGEDSAYRQAVIQLFLTSKPQIHQSDGENFHVLHMTLTITKYFKGILTGNTPDTGMGTR